MKELKTYCEVTIKFYDRGFSVISGSENGMLEEDIPELDELKEDIIKRLGKVEFVGCHIANKTCPACKGSGKSETYNEQQEKMSCSFCAGLGSVPVGGQNAS